MKSCDRYERDILSSLHGQLGPIRNVVARVHMWTCPACRERYNTFKQLSMCLAIGLRRPNSSRPMGAFITKPAFAGFRIKGLLILLIAVSAAWIYTTASSSSNAPTTPRGNIAAPVPNAAGATDACRVPVRA